MPLRVFFIPILPGFAACNSGFAGGLIGSRRTLGAPTQTNAPADQKFLGLQKGLFKKPLLRVSFWHFLFA